MERDPKERTNVIDITARIPSRMSAIAVRAELEERLVIQRFEPPPGSSVGAIEVAMEVSQVVELISALIAEGAKVARHLAARWAAHVGAVVGPNGRMAAEAFLRGWPAIRPDLSAHPSAAAVRECAYRYAENVLRSMDVLVERFGAEERGRFLRVVLKHLAYEGRSLAPEVESTCEIRAMNLSDSCLVCELLPWNLPLAQ